MSDFKRIVFEDWALWLPMVSFGVFFLVFLITSIRAIRMRKPDRERMASLPFEHSSDTSHP